MINWLLNLWKERKEKQRVKNNEEFYRIFKEEYDRYQVQVKEDLTKKFFS